MDENLDLKKKEDNLKASDCLISLTAEGSSLWGLETTPRTFCFHLHGDRLAGTRVKTRRLVFDALGEAAALGSLRAALKH